MAGAAPMIMLVDDDADFLEMNKHLLERNGYRVFCSHDPQEAMERMAQEPHHLVITDLMMKAMSSGFSFSRQIKEDPRFKEIPVIIVTAIGSRRGFDFSPRTPEDLAAMHADAYFEKPVNPDVLLAKIAELLNQDAEEEDSQ
jgi:CheY-like chemotaxis protein